MKIRVTRVYEKDLGDGDLEEILKTAFGNCDSTAYMELIGEWPPSSLEHYVKLDRHDVEESGFSLSEIGYDETGTTWELVDESSSSG